MTRTEAAFADALDRAGKAWTFHPRRVPIVVDGRPTTYQPDFYVDEDDCFYEVIGGASAYYRHKRTVPFLRQQHPALRLRFVWMTREQLPPRDTLDFTHLLPMSAA